MSSCCVCDRVGCEKREQRSSENEYLCGTLTILRDKGPALLLWGQLIGLLQARRALLERALRGEAELARCQRA